MLKGDWLRHPAIGVAAFALIGLGYAVLNPHQGESGRPDYGAQQQLNDSRERAAPAESSIPEPTPNREEWREEQDLQAQRDMARWAFIMILVSGAGVIVTACGVVYVALTLDATRAAVKATNRATNETREIGEAQSRAYLAARSGRLRINTQTGDIRFTVEIFNFGNSPATDIRFYGIAGIGPRALEFPRKTLMRPTKRISEIPVRLFREVRAGMIVGFAEPEFQLAREGNLYLYLAGNISYRDVFGKTHRTKIAVSGYTSDSPIDAEGYAEADLKPTNPGIWDQTGNADPTS